MYLVVKPIATIIAKTTRTETKLILQVQAVLPPLLDNFVLLAMLPVSVTVAVYVSVSAASVLASSLMVNLNNINE